MKNFLREALITLVLALLISLGMRVMLLQPSVVNYSSMEPTIHEGQWMWVSKIAYRLHEPERGDVIVFHAPGNSGDFIKRVIGLPGDTIEVKTGAVYVNGVPLKEPYLKEAPAYTYPETKIPEEMYFVLGDNRNDSNDSHYNWLVPRKDIVGKAWLSYWPPGDWGVIADYPLGKQLVQQ